MTEMGLFDRRLGEALLAYASEAPTDIDAVRFARTLAHAGRRNTPVAEAMVRLIRPTGRAVFIIVLLLLIALAVAAIGSRFVSKVPAVPAELAGVWEAEIAASGSDVPADRYHLNLGDPQLLAHSDGIPVAWTGRVVDLVSTSPGMWDVFLGSTDRCRPARYMVNGPQPDDDRAHGSLWFHAPPDECAERAAMLTASLWRRPEPLELVAGRAYRSLGFTEPFTFIAPDTSPPAVLDEWGSPGGLRVGMGCCWDSWLLDDQPVDLDVCHPERGTLADVPATPEAVGAWLRDSQGLLLSDPVAISVDGRTALRFDVASYDRQHSSSPLCPGSFPLEPPRFIPGFRYYAIPTGDDTILYVVWSDQGSYKSVAAGAEAFVRSMTFEQ